MKEQIIAFLKKHRNVIAIGVAVLAVIMLMIALGDPNAPDAVPH